MDELEARGIESLPSEAALGDGEHARAGIHAGETQPGMPAQDRGELRAVTHADDEQAVATGQFVEPGAPAFLQERAGEE